MNKRITRISSAIATAALAGVVLTACGSSGSTKATAQKVEQNQQANDSLTLIQAQPVPHFDWSQIRQTLIDIEGAQAKVVQTTSFFFQQGMDHPYLVCNSIGFPIASTTELTNPLQVAQDHSQYGGDVPIGQQDPTGVYTGQSAGTYVLCVNSAGQVEPNYAEPNVHTVAGPAAWDTKTQTIVFTGTPTANFKVGK